MKEKHLIYRIGVFWFWTVIVLAVGGSAVTAFSIYSTGDTIGRPWFLFFIVVGAAIALVPAGILVSIGAHLERSKARS